MNAALNREADFAVSRLNSLSVAIVLLRSRWSQIEPHLSAWRPGQWSDVMRWLALRRPSSVETVRRDLLDQIFQAVPKDAHSWPQ